MKYYNQDIFTLRLAHHMQTQLRRQSMALQKTAVIEVKGLLFEYFADLQMQGSFLFWILKIKLHLLLMWLQFSALFKDNVSLSLAVADTLCYRMSLAMKVCCVKGKKVQDFSLEIACRGGLHVTWQVKSASLYLLLQNVSVRAEQRTGNMYLALLRNKTHMKQPNHWV